MTTRIVTFQAVLATAPDAVNVDPQTAVAIPPSSLDTTGLIRVSVGSAVVTRAYDPNIEQP